MASIQRQTSPESDSDRRNVGVTDERKRKRMISNRESARRSRMKKQKQLQDLSDEMNVLKNENSKIMEKINATSLLFIDMESQNNVLRAQAMELTDRLRSLKSVLQIVEEASGFAMDIPEMPETMLNPWQMPSSVQPVVASAEMFEW